jgi:hypothetical protein
MALASGINPASQKYVPFNIENKTFAQYVFFYIYNYVFINNFIFY